MSLQNAITFLSTIETDTEFQKRASNPQDAVRLSSELNIPFTLAELKQAGEERYASLSAEELKTVAGGVCAF